MTQVASSVAGAHNLLGLDVLRHHSCLLNLSRRTLTLDEQPDLTQFSKLTPLHLDEVGHAYLEVILEAKPVSAVWDTGAGITIVDAALVERHPRLFEEVAPTVGTDAAGHSQQTATYMMGAVSIGGVAFAEQKVAAIDLTLIHRY